MSLSIASIAGASKVKIHHDSWLIMIDLSFAAASSRTRRTAVNSQTNFRSSQCSMQKEVTVLYQCLH